MMKTQLASAKETIFLTNDILIHDWDFEDCERYEYSRAQLDKTVYIECKTMSDEEFDDWRDENLSYEENYDLPMMNALRYFPTFCTFDTEDSKKCSGATCLIYDTYLNQWAVGMSGGGMDLSPHLLETFINLGNGIPLQLAKEICRNYNAYVAKETHEKNCELLANEFKKEANRNLYSAKELGLKT
jgi:hypothetical protein